MRNFLRIRDGDRFWYERDLSKEVLICTYLVQKLQRFAFMGSDHLYKHLPLSNDNPCSSEKRRKLYHQYNFHLSRTYAIFKTSEFLYNGIMSQQPKSLLSSCFIFPWVSSEQCSSLISTVSLKNSAFSSCHWKRLVHPSNNNTDLILGLIYWQEIDKVNSLTLSKIIRLNTGFKSVPENVFFSSDYCASVRDFQCVPKEEDPMVTEAETNNTVRNVLIAVSVVMFVVLVILVVFLVRFCIRLRQRRRKVIPDKEKEVHHNGGLSVEEVSWFTIRWLLAHPVNRTIAVV